MQHPANPYCAVTWGDFAYVVLGAVLAVITLVGGLAYVTGTIIL